MQVRIHKNRQVKRHARSEVEGTWNRERNPLPNKKRKVGGSQRMEGKLLYSKSQQVLINF